MGPGPRSEPELERCIAMKKRARTRVSAQPLPRAHLATHVRDVQIAGVVEAQPTGPGEQRALGEAAHVATQLACGQQDGVMARHVPPDMGSPGQGCAAPLAAAPLESSTAHGSLPLRKRHHQSAATWGARCRLTPIVYRQPRHKAPPQLWRQVAVPLRLAGIWGIAADVEGAIGPPPHAPHHPLRLPRRPAQRALPRASRGLIGPACRPCCGCWLRCTC